MPNLLHHRILNHKPDAPWLVFLRGIGGDSRTFSLQIKFFSHYFNLLLPDLRGHGMSTHMELNKNDQYSLKLIAEDVFALLDHMKIEKAHFMGCSFGAVLIRQMEQIQPERFLSCVMAGAVLRIKPSIYMIFKLGKFLSPYVNKYFLYEIIAIFLMPRKNHKHSREMFVAISKSIQPKEFNAWVVILEEVKYKLDQLYRIPFRFPVMLIMGSQDHAFLTDARRYCFAHSNTKIEIINKSGHLCNIEKHEVFNKLACDFLNLS